MVAWREFWMKGVKHFFKNTEKPQGWLGNVMLYGMNRGHASVSDWGLSFLPDDQEGNLSSIADIGCGGGRNTAQLLKRFPVARVIALDHSSAAVGKTRRLNRKAVVGGRCQAICGNVSYPPFPADSFDIVTAFETVYFWPGPTTSFREIMRILKPGGIFLIVNEADGTDPAGQKWADMIQGMQIFNQQQLTHFLEEAGFSNITVHADRQHNWLCILSKKSQGV